MSVFLDHLYAKNLLQYYSVCIQVLASGGHLDLLAGWVGGAPSHFQPGEREAKAVTPLLLQAGSEGLSPSNLHRSRKRDSLEWGENFRCCMSSVQCWDQNWDRDWDHYPALAYRLSIPWPAVWGGLVFFLLAKLTPNPICGSPETRVVLLRDHGCLAWVCGEGGGHKRSPHSSSEIPVRVMHVRFSCTKPRNQAALYE